MGFVFEGNEYTITDKSAEALDRAEELFAQGYDITDVAEAVGMPGKTPEEKVIAMRVLMLVGEVAGQR